MKTKIKYSALVVAGLVLGACSSSMQLSSSSGSKTDDIYYTPGQKSTSDAQQVADNNPLKRNSSSDINMAELEKKYSDVLAKDTTGKVDTLVYKAEAKENPYERVYSDSYQESYERRIRGLSSGYGVGAYYNDDYWYTAAYDPAFYNIIVMGSDVWVEPWHISAMFSWPGYGYYGYGYSWPYFGWGYRPWGFGFNWYWSNPYYAWGYGGYGWNNYAWGYNAGYWDGYYNGNDDGNNPYYHNGTYGVRPENGGGVITAGTRPGSNSSTIGINDLHRDLSDNQVVLTSHDATTATEKPSAILSGQDASRKPPVVTRPSRESLNVNPTRVISNNNEFKRVEPVRESYNPNYTKPKPANSNEFNRPTRNYQTNEIVRGETGKQTAIEVPQRGNQNKPEKTYNPPPRTSTPSSSPPRNDGARSNRENKVSTSSPSSSGSSNNRSSVGSSRSSSGSSGSSSSKGSSSSSSSSKNTRR